MRGPMIFQRRLAARILGVLGATSVAAVAPSCTSSGARATGTTTGATTTTTTKTKTTPPHDAGHDGAGTGASGAGGAGTGGATGGSNSGGGGSNSIQPVQACFDWPLDADAGVDAALSDAGPAPGGCPMDPAVALVVFQSFQCPFGWEPFKVVSGPTTNATQQCCYMVYEKLCGPGGRPYLVGGEAQVAPIRRGGATSWSATERAPEVASLSARERSALADAWTSDASMEHASVASFSRASLALLAVGAPSDLIELTHQAALDEVRHAELCFALASAYAGEPIAPGPFPLGDAVHVDADLASLAASTVREGCIGETVAAVVAAEQLARATDPAVRAALERIAEDEARHAELAWRIVAWALHVGGNDVSSAVARAFQDASASAAPTGDSPPNEVLLAHGRLDPVTTAKIGARTLNQVVTPAVCALLSVPRLAEGFGEPLLGSPSRTQRTQRA